MLAALTMEGLELDVRVIVSANWGGIQGDAPTTSLDANNR